MMQMSRMANLRPILNTDAVKKAMPMFAAAYDRLSQEDRRGMRLDEIMRGASGDAVEVVEYRRAEAHRRPQISREPVPGRLVRLSGRLRIGPGAEEELQEAVVEEVEEPREGVVARQPTVGLLSGRERQRALRSEESQETHKELEAPILAPLGRLQRRGREGEIGILPERHDVVARRGAIADAWRVRVGTLHRAEERQEVEAPQVHVS